ncbi:SDR family oxidoreductase [Chitinophagaceae bacterium MMS25-I14]
MSQTIFITGASSGLGKAAAKLFAEKGWKVIASMRNPEKETELTEYPAISLMKLDVTDAGQIKEVAASVIAGGGVDVVFNNAGYGLAGPLEGTTDAQLVHEIDTNLLGVIRVTQAFIPYFRENKKGLFIATTSIGGLVTFPLNSVYHATKWAIEGWSESMWYELSRFGIGIKTVSPGGIKTDFISRSLVLAQHKEYEDMLTQVFERFTTPERQETYSTAEQIAEVVYEAATDGKKQLRYVAGVDAKALYEQRQQVGYEQFMQGIEQGFFN